MKSVEKAHRLLYHFGIERMGVMKEEQFSFHSFQDNLEIRGTMLVPKKPIGIVQIVHGMSEHRRRYLPFMRYLTAQGWICVIHDHRGHGESVKSDEDLGYFNDISGTYLMEDTHQLTYLIKKRYPDLPYVLFGHSMGSLVVRSYVKKYDYELNALVVCGSPSNNSLLPLARFLVYLIACVKGDHYRSSWLQKLVFGSYAKRFSKETSENCWICSDQNVVAEYDNDPKCGFIFTTNGFRSLWNLMRNVYDRDDWAMLNPDLPILFIAGTADPCITDQRKFAQAVDFMKKVGYRQVECKTYWEMRHEILNEPDQGKVFDDVKSFLTHHVLKDK